MKLTTRLVRLGIPLIILAIPTLLCGFVISFEAAFKMWAILLAWIIPMIGGTFLITNYFQPNQKLVKFLSALLIGFTFFVFSLVGGLIDRRVSSLQQIIWFATIAGMIGLIVPVTVMTLYSILLRGIKKFRSEA